MSKLREILDGWGHLIIKDPVTEKEAEVRATFCDKCEYLNTLPGGFYLHCGKCGCYIQAKIRSKTSKCPIEKW
jgi:hypothetical protein